MEKPDKVAVALSVGIICLIFLNTWVIYHTWICGADELADMKSGKTSETTELVFHDDTSITNNGSRKLWLRVKIIYENKRDESLCRIDSAALQDGSWIQDREWYYYCQPVRAAENTRPLIDRMLRGNTNLMCQKVKHFRLQAEAVDETWLSQRPRSGQEAFQLFDNLDRAGDDLYL